MGHAKKIINRGGEEIAPREADEVLLNHPAARETLAFAMLHGRSGEDMAAAVSEASVFAATPLAAHEVPRSMVLVDEIPESPIYHLRLTGLIERLGLAATAQIRAT